MLAYLSRYTHRVAISNSRLIKVNASGVTFNVKNYRVEGPGRYTTMTLATHEFIRRFLIAPLPEAANAAAPETPEPLVRPCPCCGGRVLIVETLQVGAMRRARPSPSTMVIRIDTS